MGNLSAHFDKSEFRCQCGCGGENPSTKLIERLEQIYDLMDAKSIIITSGYRCPNYSASIGGYRNDAHTCNIAADIIVNKKGGGGSFTATDTSISITSGTSTDAYTSPFGASNPNTYRMEVEPNTIYSISISGDNSFQLIAWENGSTASGNGHYMNSGVRFSTFTTKSETTFLTFRAANTGSLGTTATLRNVMVVKGEYTSQTMPNYEPYGYKLPVVCGGSTNNIYIGANPLRKSLDGTAVDTVSSDGTLTRRVDSDGNVLVTPTTEQITAPTIPTANGSNTLNVNTTLAPSNVYIKYKG